MASGIPPARPASAAAAPSGAAPAAASEALWTLPNAVSLSRVVFAAGFVLANETGERLALVGAASLSDMLDGWLARRRNVVTRWGALIDPIADRIFALAAIASLLAGGQLTWLQCLVLLLRDVMTTIGFFTARVIRWLRAVRFRARPLGKVVTALQIAAVLCAIAWRPALPALVAVVGVTSVAATVDYTLALWRWRDRTLKP